MGLHARCGRRGCEDCATERSGLTCLLLLRLRPVCHSWFFPSDGASSTSSASPAPSAPNCPSDDLRLSNEQLVALTSSLETLIRGLPSSATVAEDVSIIAWKFKQFGILIEEANLEVIHVASSEQHTWLRLLQCHRMLLQELSEEFEVQRAAMQKQQHEPIGSASSSIATGASVPPSPWASDHIFVYDDASEDSPTPLTSHRRNDQQSHAQQQQQHWNPPPLPQLLPLVPENVVAPSKRAGLISPPFQAPASLAAAAAASSSTLTPPSAPNSKPGSKVPSPSALVPELPPRRPPTASFAAAGANARSTRQLEEGLQRSDAGRSNYAASRSTSSPEDWECCGSRKRRMAWCVVLAVLLAVIFAILWSKRGSLRGRGSDAAGVLASTMHGSSSTGAAMWASSSTGAAGDVIVPASTGLAGPGFQSCAVQSLRFVDATSPGVAFLWYERGAVANDLGTLYTLPAFTEDQLRTLQVQVMMDSSSSNEVRLRYGDASSSSVLLVSLASTPHIFSSASGQLAWDGRMDALTIPLRIDAGCQLPFETTLRVSLPAAVDSSSSGDGGGGGASSTGTDLPPPPAESSSAAAPPDVPSSTGSEDPAASSTGEGESSTGAFEPRESSTGAFEPPL